MLLGYQGRHHEGAYVFDLRSERAPDFDFEVDADGAIYAGLLEGNLEAHDVVPGESLLVDADARPPFRNARFLENTIDDDAYTGWSAIEAQPPLFSRIPPPDAPDKTCRYVEVTHTLDVGVIGLAAMVVVDPDAVLVAGAEGGMFEVTRSSVTRITELEEAPSALLWADGEGAFWSIDRSAQLAHIERAATGYRWTRIDTATTAIADPMRGTSGLGAEEVGVLTSDGDILFRSVSEPTWRRHHVPFNPDESPMNLDLEWVAPQTLFVANGFPEPRRLVFGGAGVDDTRVDVMGPEVEDFLNTFGFARSERGLHMVTAGLLHTHFMLFEGTSFRADRPSIIPRLPGVAIDAWGDGRLLYRTKGTLVGIDDDDGCVEPRELVGLGLRFPRFLDADHGVVIDQGDLVRLPVRVLFLEFREGPSRFDP